MKTEMWHRNPSERKMTLPGTAGRALATTLALVGGLTVVPGITLRADSIAITREAAYNNALELSENATQTLSAVEGAEVQFDYMRGSWPAGEFYNLPAWNSLDPVPYNSTEHGGFTGLTATDGSFTSAEFSVRSGMTATHHYRTAWANHTIGTLFYAVDGRPQITVTGSFDPGHIVSPGGSVGPTTVFWSLFHSPDGAQANAVTLDDGSFTIGLDGQIAGSPTINSGTINLTGDGYLGLFVFNAGHDRAWNVGDSGIVYTASIPEPRAYAALLALACLLLLILNPRKLAPPTIVAESPEKS